MALAVIHAYRRIWLLPLLLMALALFVSPGISIPRFDLATGAGLSIPSKGKPSTCAGVKAQSKSSHSRIVKTTSPLDLRAGLTLATRTPQREVFIPSPLQSVTSRRTATIPARAPPA